METESFHLMQSASTLIMDTFPDFGKPGFDVDQYNKRFHNSNVVIRASARAIEYPEHWSPLSVKCAFHGEEHYETPRAHYAVSDEHFLVFNNGKTYSSWIKSSTEVDSLTLNIAPGFEQMALRSIATPSDRLLDDPFDDNKINFRFTERLYRHGPGVSPVVRQMMNERDPQTLDRLFYFLMEDLLSLQSGTNLQIGRIDKVRASTRTEIFERLQRAKDYIHSCYRNPMLLEEMAGVACMNAFYFLRQFRNTFNITPHQFLTERRLQVACTLLRTTDKAVSDVCLEVGFSDPSSFAKLFRRRYGFSPGALRMYVKS